jgi:hypothetical protein
MTQRPWTFVSSFVVLTALGIVACSSADEQEDDGAATGGSSGSATGGSTATGGTASGGTASGGTSPTGGTGGTGDTPNADPECKSIKSNGACTLPDKACPNLVCGIADSGRRECNCSTTWTCTPCDYTNSPFKDKPPNIVACATGTADEVSCTTLNEVCGPVGTEYCACYQHPLEGLIWDCDSPPSTWM